MTTLTITADMENGEQAFFKVKPLVSIDEVLSAVDWVVSPQCVLDLAEDGVWEIV